MADQTIYSSLTQLGQDTPRPQTPEAAVLERVPNPQDVAYCVRFTAPEFTSLCPMTGQPDFAHLVIDYVPADWLVGSKSLKLFLGSFRDHGAFHEDCTITIARRLVTLLEPQWLRIGGVLVSAGRHSHRRVLSDGSGAIRSVDSGSGRGPVSRTGLTRAGRQTGESRVASCKPGKTGVCPLPIAARRQHPMLHRERPTGRVPVFLCPPIVPAAPIRRPYPMPVPYSRPANE